MKKKLLFVVTMFLFIFLPSSLVIGVESQGNAAIEIVSEENVKTPLLPPTTTSSNSKSYLPATGEKTNRFLVFLGVVIVLFILIQKNEKRKKK